MMGAAQALDLREFKTGEGVTAARRRVRETVEFLDVDRSLAPDHTAMQALVKSCEVLETVEAVTGDLTA